MAEPFDEGEGDATQTARVSPDGLFFLGQGPNHDVRCHFMHARMHASTTIKEPPP